MIAKISNLGPIKSVSVDLRKPFTLFCGPNNTGKTYLSYILYAIYRDFGHVYSDVVHEWIKCLFEKQEITINQDSIERFIYDFCRYIKSYLGYFFGIGNETVKRLFGDFNLELSLCDGEYDAYVKNPRDIVGHAKDAVVHISKKDKSIKVTYQGEENPADRSTGLSYLLHSMLNNMLRNMCLGDMDGVRMLTVERNSIYTFKTELSLTRNELIERIQQKADGKGRDIINLVNKNSRRYPIAISDSLRIANDLENIKKNIGPYFDVAQQIEKGVLRGEVKITKNGEVEFAPTNMGGSEQLPIHLSSSIVKTMSSLVIYLKHIANKGDVLIIDEPELNFHPDVQIYLMRIFASLINKGLHLIVSTHSDYVVREVNNLIMAKKIYSKHSKDVNDLGYKRDMLLNKDDIVVKYFQYEGAEQKVVVNDVEIYDDGFSVESIDNTISRQNDTTEWLYNILVKEKEMS